jgi:hypothetical protein
MSFREKSAWIILITIVFVSLLYILHLPQPWTLSPTPNLFLFHVLLLSVGTFVLLTVIGHVVIAVRAPREALAPKDERERLIDLKATRLAAYVYAFLSLGSIALIHHGANQIGLAYCMLASFVIAEIVNYAARIVYYRRGV